MPNARSATSQLSRTAYPLYQYNTTVGIVVTRRAGYITVLERWPKLHNTAEGKATELFRSARVRNILKLQEQKFQFIRRGNVKGEVHPKCKFHIWLCLGR